MELAGQIRCNPLPFLIQVEWHQLRSGGFISHLFVEVLSLRELVACLGELILHRRQVRSELGVPPLLRSQARGD